MDSSEELLESLSRKIEEREKRARRIAWLVTVIPIILAGLLLVYTIQQISIKQEELDQKTKDVNQITTQLASVNSTMEALNTKVPEAEATLAAVETAYAQLQTDLSQAQVELTQAEAQLAEKVAAARILAAGPCQIDETVLKEYASNYTSQAQMLIFLFDKYNTPWNPNGFSEVDGFDSPNFALYALEQQGLISSNYEPGTLPWQILPMVSSPTDGDIIYYQSGYTMFYFELPVRYGSQETTACVIGMTPLGVVSLHTDFAEQLGVLKVPYP